MVLGKLSMPGRPTIWTRVGQGPTALAVGAGGGGLDIFLSRLPFLSSFSRSLWETTRYRLKYCLKGPLSPKQPTNHPLSHKMCIMIEQTYVQSPGWAGGAMVLGKLQVPWRPTFSIIVGHGPIALAVGAGGGCLDIFTLLYPFSPLSPCLWETDRYRLKYCLKGPLNPKQSINQYVQSTQLIAK